MIDGFYVDDAQRNSKEYNGSETKFGITVNDTEYIVKFQKHDWRNVQSEIVASRFMNIIGIEAHKTYFGYYNNRLVAICEDFTKTHGELKTLSSLNSSSIDTLDDRHDYFLEDVMYELLKIHNVDKDDVIHGTIAALTNELDMYIRNIEESISNFN